MGFLYLYWCCNLVCHVRGEHRLRVVEDRAKRKIFGPKREEERGGNNIMESVTICTAQLILFGQ